LKARKSRTDRLWQVIYRSYFTRIRPVHTYFTDPYSWKADFSF